MYARGLYTHAYAQADNTLAVADGPDNTGGNVYTEGKNSIGIAATESTKAYACTEHTTLIGKAAYVTLTTYKPNTLLIALHDLIEMKNESVHNENIQRYEAAVFHGKFTAQRIEEEFWNELERRLPKVELATTEDVRYPLPNTTSSLTTSLTTKTVASSLTKPISHTRFNYPDPAKFNINGPATNKHDSDSE